jgi:hypothetical protein
MISMYLRYRDTGGDAKMLLEQIFGRRRSR